jgi:2,4-dienoyl-CoA reductase-like NADH-dependent reductase (Old Yellow Enzyme family)
MTSLFDPLSMARGPALKNRFVLAPLTNLQSHPDGVLSDDEFRWLTMRAEGGFALTMSCAASVQAAGVGFPGQLGVHDDKHLPGLRRLAGAIKAQDSVAVVQLHHAGMRSPSALIGGAAPLCPSADEKTNARVMTADEVARTRDDFIAAAKRAERAGFNGAELHGAHGYLICQFLSAEINRREDAYGGSPENRARFLIETIDGVRAACGKDFSLGVRLSPERFGMDLMEIVALAQRLMRDAKVDYIDLSLWDAFKEPAETARQGRTLLSYFTALDRGPVRLGAAGKIMSGADCAAMLAQGLDFVLLGRAAILHHDYPRLVAQNAAFTPAALPVSADHLRREGLGEAFVKYMRTWAGFVAAEPAPAV